MSTSALASITPVFSLADFNPDRQPAMLANTVASSAELTASQAIVEIFGRSLAFEFVRFATRWELTARDILSYQQFCRDIISTGQSVLALELLSVLSEKEGRALTSHEFGMYGEVFDQILITHGPESEELTEEGHTWGEQFDIGGRYGGIADSPITTIDSKPDNKDWVFQVLISIAEKSDQSLTPDMITEYLEEIESITDIEQPPILNEYGSYFRLAGLSEVVKAYSGAFPIESIRYCGELVNKIAAGNKFHTSTFGGDRRYSHYPDNIQEPIAPIRMFEFSILKGETLSEEELSIFTSQVFRNSPLTDSVNPIKEKWQVMEERLTKLNKKDLAFHDKLLIFIGAAEFAKNNNKPELFSTILAGIQLAE